MMKGAAGVRLAAPYPFSLAQPTKRAQFYASRLFPSPMTQDIENAASGRGETGRRKGLKIPRPWLYGFEPRRPHHFHNAVGICQYCICLHIVHKSELPLDNGIFDASIAPRRLSKCCLVGVRRWFTIGVGRRFGASGSSRPVSHLFWELRWLRYHCSSGQCNCAVSNLG